MCELSGALSVVFTMMRRRGWDPKDVISPLSSSWEEVRLRVLTITNYQPWAQQETLSQVSLGQKDEEMPLLYIKQQCQYSDIWENRERFAYQQLSQCQWFKNILHSGQAIWNILENWQIFLV